MLPSIPVHPEPHLVLPVCSCAPLYISLYFFTSALGNKCLHFSTNSGWSITFYNSTDALYNHFHCGRLCFGINPQFARQRDKNQISRYCPVKGGNQRYRHS